MESIPAEIGNLHKLRLLDLDGCTSSKLPLIPASVLSKLSRLEGLYMYNKMQSVVENKSEFEEANATEKITLPYLNALEIEVAVTERLPFDGQIIKNLDIFRIALGSYPFNVTSRKEMQNFCRSLYLGYTDLSEFLELSCLKLLLKKADYLLIAYCGEFEDVVPLLDQEGFRNLRYLRLCACKDIKCIVDGNMMNNMVVFPCLQSLKLEFLASLEKVCNEDVSPGSFSNLQTFKLFQLDELRFGLPLVPRNVIEIHLHHCEMLEYIFIEDEEVLATDLPFLKTLDLHYLPDLLSLVGPKEFSNNYEVLRGAQLFFGEKIGLPSLEFFKLDSCDNVVNLWSKEICTPGFQNLKDIQISLCHNLSRVGSPSVFSNLVQLEKLTIIDCDELHEVISHEEIEESEMGEQCIVFPQLQHFRLEYSKNLESFYRGRSKLEFPKLKKMVLNDLLSMKMFAKSENSSALFHEKIDFPCLEELKVISVNDDVTGLWDKQSLTMKPNPAPMLKELKLGSSAGLRQIPSVVLENLTSLSLTFHSQDVDVVFSSSDLGEKGSFVWIYPQLPNLEGLKVKGCDESIQELFEKEDFHANNDALSSFCGRIKILWLKSLPSLNLIPLHLFKSIDSLTLYELKWNYLISADVLNSLYQLRYLQIESCCDMKALVINVGSQIKLPSLKHLYLEGLDSFIGISSLPKDKAALLLPSLESLEINACHRLEHFWLGSISAPRLERVILDECINLQQFLVGNPGDKIELPSLRKVSSSYCYKMKSISTGSLSTPELREVELHRCDNMQCFFPGNQNHDGDLQLPSLEIVNITGCGNLHAFSHRRLVAPKLTQITYHDDDYSVLPYDDLNHFLKEFNPIINSKDEEEFKKDDGRF